MKRILAFITVLVLLCGMLVSCDNALVMVQEANKALEEAPYEMTVKTKFECDDYDIYGILSSMNLEIPVTVDGENISTNMSVGAMGFSVSAKVIVVDMVAYLDISMLGRQLKMKATLDEEAYNELMSESNAEMIINPEDFESLDVETKDGKKYIACAEISDEALAELNDMMEQALKSVNGKATVKDIVYSVTLNDGKYESMDMTCFYSVTVSDKACDVTFKLSADFAYDNIEEVVAPSDASEYQEADLDNFLN